MTKQVIQLGSAVNDGTGDPIRTAFTKVNANFTELYNGQFNGTYDALTGKPTIPTDVSDLTDTESLLGGGTADLGDFKIQGSVLGTTAENNGWGGSDINISPNGEGYAWIYIPKDTNATSGSTVTIGNTASAGGGVQLSVNAGAWTFNNDGSLEFPDGSIQTTAYTVSEPTPLFVVVNVDGNLAYSNNGEDWTNGSTLTVNGESIDISRVSIADNYIVYINDSEGDSGSLFYAESHLDSTPTRVTSFPSNFDEATGTYRWNDIQYGGGYTVAVGFFDITEGPTVPAFAYTNNGSSWTLGSIDPEYQTEFAIDSQFKSVDYNGTGWLIVASRNTVTNQNNDGTGAFYITSLSSQLNQGNFVSPSQILQENSPFDWNIDRVVWTGDRWWVRDSSEDENNSKGYIVSSGSNPLTSTWTLVNVTDPSNTAGFGAEVEYWEDAGGTIDGVHWFVAANGDGQVIASSDGGETFVTSIPQPYTGTVAGITSAAESTISFDDEDNEPDSESVGEKIILSNAVPSSYNGTYYVVKRGVLDNITTRGINNTNWVEGTYSDIEIAEGVFVEISINSEGGIGQYTITDNGGVLFDYTDTFNILGSVFGGTDDTDDMTLYVSGINNGDYYLYTDSDLEVPLNTTGLNAFVSADVLFSHGQFIDSLGFGLEKFIAGNDDEELFTSSDLESWTKVNDQTEEGFNFWNDISFNPEFLAGDVTTSDTGNITFDGVEIRGIATEQRNGLIKLVPAVSLDEYSFLDYGQFVQIYPTNTYDAPHIHIAAGIGGETEGDIFLGDDNKYVQVNHNGEVSIQSYDSAEDITYNWTFGDNGTIIFPSLTTNLHNGGNQTAQTLQFGNPNQQVVITGPTPTGNESAQRLIIQGQRGAGIGEGGDVYVWGGDAETDGGDIKIYAGDADGESAGYGGYVNLEGGTGYTQGGGISITGGSSSGGTGGGVSIQGGSGSTSADNGTVSIQTGSHYWNFQNDGDLRFPDNTVQTTAWTGVLSNPTYVGSTEIGEATPAPLNLNNSAEATLLTQLNLINTGGQAGSGSAIDFWTYTSINDVPEVRLGAVDDGNYSADFSIALKGTGNSGNNELTTTWTFGSDGVLTLPGNIQASDDLSITVPSGIPSGVTNWNGQGGWNQGSYTNLATTGGTGTGLTVDVVGGEGYISIENITINNPGSGYTDGDVITIDNENSLPGTFTITVAAPSWEFGSTGDLTLPASGNIVDSTGVNQTAQRVEGSWTLPDDSTDTYSFTVPMDGTYTMWVKGNIPNGIIIWNATVSVTNSNVPAIGTQYAWNYTGGGSPIELINIPDQIRGTAGTISTDATYAGTTSNRFDFNISNSSGSAQTVYYGYTKV